MSDTMQSSSQPANNKSKFIRTYAKDVAALAGGPTKILTEKPAPPAPPPPVKAPSPVRPTPPRAEIQKAKPDPEREATLERLRAKVAASPAPAPSPRPAPPPPPPPVFETPTPKPVPPIPPIASEKPSPIHTYTSDFADRIDERGAATFSVLAAQQDAGPTIPVQTRKKGSAVLVSIAVGLIVLGGAGLATATWYVLKTNTLPGGALSAPSLIFADEQVRLTGSGPDLMSEITALANEPLPEGNVLVLYLTEATTTPKGEAIEVPLAGGALITAMQLPAPDILLRNISEKSTVGIIHSGEETRPFFVFGVTSYERTFAGMLAWERSMGRDLTTLYPARGTGELAPAATSTSIGTSTPVYIEPIRAQDTFIDAIVANHDVRVLKDTKGQTLLLYGYVGKNLLVLARDEVAYSALLSRLAAGR